MVKSVKAIIIVSVMVSMSMMLINSCGVSSPTASSGNTGVLGLSAATGCVPSVPGTPDPSIYLPVGISSDAAKALLENPYANPNASGTLVPVEQLYGDYLVGTGGGGSTIVDGINTIATVNPDGTTTYTFLKGYLYYQVIKISGSNSPSLIVDKNIPTVFTNVVRGSILISTTFPPDKRWTYTISSGLFPPGTMLPSDFFAGKGYPDGDYVIGGDWFSLVGGKATWKGRVNQPCTKDGAYPKKPPVVASLTITPQDVSIGANKTTQFSVVGTMSDGTPANPAIINKGTVNWVSSNASIAVIYNGGTSGGQAWGKSKGTVDIWAEHNGIKSNVAKLHVGNQLQSISVSPASATIYIHSQPNSITYTASGSFTDGSTKPVIPPVTWATLPGGIANIDSTGKATAVSPGTTYITAASDSITSGANDVVLNVECKIYTDYKQNQDPWGPKPLGYYTKADLPQKSFAWIACALTNFSNIIGVTPEYANSILLNPATPAQYRYANTPDSKADTNWWAADYISNYNVIYDDTHTVPSYIKKGVGFTHKAYSISEIDKYLLQCNSVIVGIAGVYGGKKRLNHYVLIVGKDSKGNYIVHDPATYIGIKELPPTTQIHTHIIFVHQN